MYGVTIATWQEKQKVGQLPNGGVSHAHRLSDVNPAEYSVTDMSRRLHRANNLFGQGTEDGGSHPVGITD